MHTEKKNHRLIIFIICMMGVMSQFATDSYSSSLPEISRYFGGSENSIKMTIGIYFMGMSFSSVFFGYLSDKIGRKKVLIMGYILFCIGSTLCFLAQSQIELLIYRFIQGISMGSSLVSFRAIMKDVFKTDDKLAQASIITTSVISFTPPLAPISGSYIQNFFGWRYNFILHLIMGLLMIFLIVKFLKLEKLNEDNSNLIDSYKRILKNRVFITNSICSGLALSVIFIFVTASPFIFQNELNYSASDYSFIFPIIIIPAAFLSLLLQKKIKTLNMNKLMLCCGAFSIFGSVMLSISYLFYGISAKIIIFFCMIIFCSNTFQFPASYTCAYRTVKKNIGVASSIYGLLQVLVTSIFSLLVSIINLKNQLYLGLFIILPLLILLILKFSELHYRDKNYH